MEAKRRASRRLLMLAMLLGSIPPAFAAEQRTRGEDACQADIHRLCDTFFPDAKLVATCLVDRRAELSPACAELLADPPGVAEPVEPAVPAEPASPR